MTYKVRILENAQQDLDWLRRNDKTSYIKCFDLVQEMMIDPRNGTGKPERLRYFDKEVYSRRVNHKDRLSIRFMSLCRRLIYPRVGVIMSSGLVLLIISF